MGGCLNGCADSKQEKSVSEVTHDSEIGARKEIDNNNADKEPVRVVSQSAKTPKTKTAIVESTVGALQSENDGDSNQSASPVDESLLKKSGDRFADLQLTSETTVLELEKKVTLRQLSQISQHETLETLILDGGIELPIGATNQTAALSHLKQIVKLKKLIHLRIRNCEVDDDGIQLLSKLSDLRILNLPQANFSDAAMPTLAKMPNLELLRFSSEKVTDEGIQFLAKAKSLRALHLIRLGVSDQIVPSICAIKPLETFYVDGSKMTDEGYSKLIEKRPDLHLHVDQVHLDYDPRKH